MELPRPGGAALTERAIKLSGLKSHATVADIGCGKGETAALMREKYGYKAVGVDINPPLDGEEVIYGDSRALPFENNSLDGIFFECSFSKMGEQESVLLQCKRCLIPGGTVVVTDLYARGESREFSGFLGKISTKMEIVHMFAKYGFQLDYFEDHSHILKNHWAGLVFQYGSNIYQGIDEKALKDTKCGYFLAIFKFPESSLEKLLPRALQYASKNSLFYRKTLAGATELKKLPFTYPEDLSANGPAMLCASSGDVERIVSLSTSASTGPEKRVCFTKNDLERTISFFARGMWDIAGDSVIILMSGERENSVADLLKKGLDRIGVKGEIYGNIKDVDDCAQKARLFQTYVGFPGEIAYLCRAYPDLSPSSVLLSADYVPKSVVQAIESTWKCPVFLHYGMTETCYGLAVQCRRREGLHIRNDEFIVEVVDPQTGEALPDGAPGEIVVTSLKNEAMPLIRYKTGDLGVLSSIPCECGIPGALITKIFGRIKNIESKLSIHALDEYMYSLPGLKNYAAEIDGTELYLTIDGPEVDEDQISNLFHFSIKTKYADLSPCTGPQKRRITERPEVGAVIAAAGKSSRMGAFKPLLPFRQTTVIEEIIKTLQSAGVDNITVVTGREAKTLESRLNIWGVDCLYNKDFAETDMFYSVKMGLAHIKAKKIIFLPADSPLFKKETLTALLSAINNGYRIVTPTWEGRPGHPVLISEEAVLELLNYDGNGGLKAAIAAYTGPKLLLPVSDSGIVYDADYMADYQLLQRIDAGEGA